MSLKPLAGLVVAVTSRREGEGDDDDKDSYSALAKRVEQLGGKVSKMVHKNVAFVVATESSLALSSQRVRKARKRGLDVVLPEYLEACAQARAALPRDDYRR